MAEKNMEELATSKQHQQIQRLAEDYGYKNAQEFLAFNMPKLFSYQKLLGELTIDEAARLIVEGE